MCKACICLTEIKEEAERVGFQIMKIDGHTVLALLKRIETLEKEADWLTSQLSKCETDSEYTLPFCPYELDKQPEYCDYDEKLAYDASCDGEMPCTHKIEECWRRAARKAVEAQCKRN